MTTATSWSPWRVLPRSGFLTINQNLAGWTEPAKVHVLVHGEIFSGDHLRRLAVPLSAFDGSQQLDLLRGETEMKPSTTRPHRSRSWHLGRDGVVETETEDEAIFWKHRIRFFTNTWEEVIAVGTGRNGSAMKIPADTCDSLHHICCRGDKCRYLQCQDSCGRFGQHRCGDCGEKLIGCHSPASLKDCRRC